MRWVDGAVEEVETWEVEACEEESAYISCDHQNQDLYFLT